MKLEKILKNKGYEIFSIHPEDDICYCIKLLTRKNVGALIVLDSGNKTLGIVSERDILQKTLDERGFVTEFRVKDVMVNKEDLVTTDINEPTVEVMRKMIERNIRHMPITKDGELIGILSIKDIVKSMLDDIEKGNPQIKTYFAEEATGT